jgi:hypothetical protein
MVVILSNDGYIYLYPMAFSTSNFAQPAVSLPEIDSLFAPFDSFDRFGSQSTVGAESVITENFIPQQNFDTHLIPFTIPQGTKQPMYKLSVHLSDTYKRINGIYQTNKWRQEQPEQHISRLFPSYQPTFLREHYPTLLFYSISAMPYYDTLSIDEIRWQQSHLNTESMSIIKQGAIKTRNNNISFTAYDSLATLPSTCPMCERVYQLPRTLHCGHPLCTPCIQALQSLHTLRTNKDETSPNTIKCPICAVDTTLSNVQDLPPYETLTKCFSPNCTKTAECYCATCDKACCDSCFARLHEIIGNHEMLLLNQAHELLCSTHGIKLEYYCESCVACLCSHCLLVHNKPNHTITKQTELRNQEFENELTKPLNELNDHLEMLHDSSVNLEEKTTFAKSMLEQKYAIAKRQLEQCYGKALQYIEQAHADCISSASKQQESVQTLVDYVNHIMNEKSSTSALGRRTVIGNLALQLSSIPLQNNFSDTNADLISFEVGVHSVGTKPPVVTYSGHCLFVTWQPQPQAMKYRLRVMIESIKVDILIGSTLVFADSSYGQRGILIYTGKNTNFEFNYLRYGGLYTFTVEAIDSNESGVISRSSKPFKLTPPELTVQVEKSKNTLLLTCNPVKDTSVDYLFSYNYIDSDRKYNIPKSTNRCVISDYIIGTFIQFQVSARHKCGTIASHKSTLPTLLTDITLVQQAHNTRKSGQSFENWDIFEYLRFCQHTVKVTTDEDWLVIDFSELRVMPEMLRLNYELFPVIEAHSVRYDGSNDGRNWISLNFDHIRTLHYDTQLLNANTYYSLIRFRSESKDISIIEGSFQLFGSIRTFFALSNKLGSSMFEKLKKFDDITFENRGENTLK